MENPKKLVPRRSADPSDSSSWGFCWQCLLKPYKTRGLFSSSSNYLSNGRHNFGATRSAQHKHHIVLIVHNDQWWHWGQWSLLSSYEICLRWDKAKRVDKAGRWKVVHDVIVKDSRVFADVFGAEAFFIFFKFILKELNTYISAEKLDPNTY